MKLVMGVVPHSPEQLSRIRRSTEGNHASLSDVVGIKALIILQGCSCAWEICWEC